MKSHGALPSLEDDGLFTPDVGVWAETKYRLVSLYDHLFSTGMKKMWDCRVYIDLFAGAGRSKIKGTNRIVSASPMLALGVKDRFDKYIFCEKDYVCLDALRQRAQNSYPSVDIDYIEGDCNEKINKVLKTVPAYSRDKKVLSFCFVDPYNIAVNFETIRVLSQRYMDFLIVLASGMDANRNEHNYMKGGLKFLAQQGRCETPRSGCASSAPCEVGHSKGFEHV